MIIKNDQDHGFVLAEAIISLIIILFGCNIMLASLKVVNKPSNYQQISFYRLVSLLESDKFNFKFKTASKDAIILSSSVTKKNYRLRKVNDVVFLAGHENGYVPLLNNVKVIKFYEVQRDIRLNVEFNNGEECHAQLDL
ncbi:ComGF family competence protein [Lentilactobacillus kosonis]|uniref:Competence protein ComGF n=1 Tax=Lentilactobacillus kosonis TaxID=2810561 RepID=A0A401FLH4_9LACO|nr:ComGF family competence protein [Lentilactobacillus kosonis]GAY73156.1 hypothetical protein NBRC111893_1302 [Lentilactobacillus kosonis]